MNDSQPTKSPGTAVPGLTRAISQTILFILICTSSFGCQNTFCQDMFWCTATCTINCLSCYEDCISRITLKGDVVDEDDNPIHGITFGITQHWSGFIKHKATKTQIIDGNFDLNVFGSYAISVSFEKEGYQTEEFSLTRKDYRRLRECMQPDGRARIVLKKKGDEP